MRSVRAVGRCRATFLGHLRNPFNVRGDVVGRRALFANRFGDFLDHSNRIATPFADLLDGRIGFLRPFDTKRYLADHTLHAADGIAGAAAHGIDGLGNFLRR